MLRTEQDITGLVQNCGISIAYALEIPQSCTKAFLTGDIPSDWLAIYYTVARHNSWKLQDGDNWVIPPGLADPRSYSDFWQGMLVEWCNLVLFTKPIHSVCTVGNVLKTYIKYYKILMYNKLMCFVEFNYIYLIHTQEERMILLQEYLRSAIICQLNTCDLVSVDCSTGASVSITGCLSLAWFLITFRWLDHVNVIFR